MDSQDASESFYLRNWLSSYLRHAGELTPKQRQTSRENLVDRLRERRRQQELFDRMALER